VASEGFYADLAEAIVDDVSIDWAAAESSDSGDERGLVARLKLIAAVAALHRRLSPSDPASEVTAIGADASKRWGHLQLLESIGRGAFGVVYRA
jgi:hypothetical protein